MASGNTVKVLARFRPQNKVELSHGGEPIVEFESEDTCKISSKENSGSFTFDRVFDMASKQSDVFDYSIRPTVDDILNGYNGTVFAYGQTGAGKSYTMMGADIDDQDAKGIIPRIVEQIFASILASPESIEYTVRVSYMEIYMERIRDLLQPQNDNLPVHEEKSRGVYVKGLLEIYVSSVQEVYEVMRRGGLARAVAATNMNQESSRSHSIFVITVTQKNEAGSVKSGQLFLVDLAGSEKVGKTGASGQTLEEAKKINKSLSALGMVINSLTDGKSTHIPYRDSKLTRILQESLGGNSRTTLIINCSPSSYNDDETLSTLRFGMRAKSIKNKAKVNTELSPAELKALLKKAQTQVTTFENYVATLEQEVHSWRAGDAVPKDRWTPSMSVASPPPTSRDAKAKPETSATKLRDAEAAAAPTSGSRPDSPALPSRPDSRLEVERAGTPLGHDERDDFLRRENELQDQLSERESTLSGLEKALADAKTELTFLRERAAETSRDNERLTGEVNELRLGVEKMQFETKEAGITMDGLKEANTELTAELDEVKQQLLDARMSARESGEGLSEKERLKRERMAEMMAGFDLGNGEIFSDNERMIRQVIERMDSMIDVSSSGEAVAPQDLEDLRQKLVETQGIVRQAELSVNERGELDDAHTRRREALEQKLAGVQREYASVLERNLSETNVEEIKQRLEDALSDETATRHNRFDELQGDLQRRADENARLRIEVEGLQSRIKNGAAGTMLNGSASPAANATALPPPGTKSVQQQIAEFDVMKKSLMRDLQNRCERVVELEISLDETREQYNNVLRSSNNRAQQKKMAFLERNLEQLTVVQRQLVEQNSALKKEVAIAERKLLARNERIQSLEALLADSQEKLTAANHRFETQLTAVKERLEAAKLGSTRGLGGPGGAGAAAGGFSFVGGGGSRIAKPLRGGGGAAVEGSMPINPALAEVAGNAQGNKRSSWFFTGKTTS